MSKAKPSLQAAQRIAAVLRNRGIEATPAETAEWINDFRKKLRRTIGSNVWPTGNAIAKLVEDNHRIATFDLHMRFGDALE